MEESKADPDGLSRDGFAHDSERKFARLLDFYGIAYEYEPRSFPIEFDEDGAPLKLFTPDFYLVDEDVYIEITTMNQRLVTKKNRKVRRLREVYPEIACKVFYLRDYQHLLLKYGLDTDGEWEAPSRVPGPPQIVNLGDESR